MPTDNSFKKQTQSVRKALANFNTVLAMDAPGLIRPALLELVDVTAALANHASTFLTHPLFQELVPAVHNAIEAFKTKNPDFELPGPVADVAKLDTKVKEALRQSVTKKGRFHLVFLPS